MVKSIADGMGVKTPGFVTYIVKSSLPILLPILALAGWWFLEAWRLALVERMAFGTFARRHGLMRRRKYAKLPRTGRSEVCH
jgi:hypothetical protein